MNRAAIVSCAASALILGMARIASAQNDVCIPVTPTAPVIDGVLAGDPGWEGASRIDLDVSGVAPVTYLRLCRTEGTNPRIYIGLRVETSSIAPTSFDRIIVALRPLDADDAAASNHAWRIHVDPFSVTNEVGTYSPGGVQFWKNSSTWNSEPTGTNPNALSGHFLNTSTMKITYEGMGKWGFEMSLKLTTVPGEATPSNPAAVYIPPSGKFKFYFDVVKLEGYGFACQYPWPKGVTVSPTLTGGTPLPGNWGNAFQSLVANCAVDLRYDKIGLIVPPSSANYKIAVYSPMTHSGDCATIIDADHLDQMGPPNQFYAKPRNRMPIPADVSAEFSIADWGVPAPGDWFTVSYPGTVTPPLTPLPNPTPPHTLTSGQLKTINLEWPLTYRQTCELGSPIEKSIRVQMTGGPDTKFAENPVIRCSSSGVASRFTHDARVGTRGYPPTPAGVERMILTVTKNASPRVTPPPPVRQAAGGQPVTHVPARDVRALLRAVKDSDVYVTAEEFASPDFSAAVSETLNWTCRAYRRTGGTLSIDGRTVELVQPAGGFQYVVGHAGEVESWKATFTGQGLRAREEGFYDLEIPAGAAALVRTEIEAVEFRSWAFGLRLGFAFPHGDFADAFDGGACETVTAEYRFTPMISLEARLGYASFEGDDPVPDAGLLSNSINGKVSILDGDFRPFANAGIGYYAADPGDDDWGVNAGAGVRWRISDLVGLEASCDFHNLFADGENPRFSTVQLGVSLRF